MKELTECNRLRRNHLVESWCKAWMNLDHHQPMHMNWYDSRYSICSKSAETDLKHNHRNPSHWRTFNHPCTGIVTDCCIMNLSSLSDAPTFLSGALVVENLTTGFIPQEVLATWFLFYFIFFPFCSLQRNSVQVLTVCLVQGSSFYSHGTPGKFSRCWSFYKVYCCICNQ